LESLRIGVRVKVDSSGNNFFSVHLGEVILHYCGFTRARNTDVEQAFAALFVYVDKSDLA
jgi:hypothetical protein